VRDIFLSVSLSLSLSVSLSSSLRVYVRVCADGLAPPIQKWQKAVNDQLEKIKKLEETYEHELIIKKV